MILKSLTFAEKLKVRGAPQRNFWPDGRNFSLFSLDRREGSDVLANFIVTTADYSAGPSYFSQTPQTVQQLTYAADARGLNRLAMVSLVFGR